MPHQAIGLLETRGLVALVEGTDAMLKSANVELAGPMIQVGNALVTAVVEAPQGAWPTSCHPLYPMAGEEIMEYLEACGREDFDGYLKQRLLERHGV